MPETPSDAVIEAHDLTKRYGATSAVDRVNVRVPLGTCWGLLGPNGAGKSTFLRMVAGTTAPTCGHLRVLGHDIPAAARRMRVHLGWMPQHDNLDPDFTVEENLRTYASYFGLRGGALERRIDRLVDFAALGERRHARIDQLSGGMQRRLSLSRALINEPRLLILDEPTTGLDPQARQLIWQRLRELHASGMTLVLTTHYLEEAERLCERVSIMDHGRMLVEGSPAELKRRHIEPQVIECFGAGLDDFDRSAGQHLAVRRERVGATMFYYLDDEAPMLKALGRRRDLEYIHRRANLEDVFLKLTGRELRDG